jgi:hypothetical protein
MTGWNTSAGPCFIWFITLRLIRCTAVQSLSKTRGCAQYSSGGGQAGGVAAYLGCQPAAAHALCEIIPAGVRAAPLAAKSATELSLQHSRNY